MLSDVEFTYYAQKYRDMVFRVAFNYLKHRQDADDVTQSVFLKLYRASKPFDGEEHLKHWLLRVAINECKNLFRSPWRHTEPLDSGLSAFSFPSEEHAELMDAVMRLKPQYRTAIYLYYFEDCTTGQIAKLLGIPRATVLTHLRRARAALKHELEAEDYV